MIKTQKYIKCCILLSLSITTAYAEPAPFSVYFDTSTPDIVENDRVTFDGVRVDGLGYSANKDAFKVEYLFDHSTLNFNYQSIKYFYPDVGVFYGQFMVIEPEPAQPDYVVDGISYQSGTENSFSSQTSIPFIATFDLKKGHYINHLIRDASVDYKLSYSGNDINQTSFNSAQNSYGGTRVIRIDGTYTLKIEPTNPADSLTFNLTTWNGNGKPLETIIDGSNIVASIKKSTHEYYKYRLHLNEGDFLEVPGGDDFKKVLLDNIGRKVDWSPDATFIYQAKRAGDYYLFISDLVGGSNRTYSGTISITPESEIRSRNKQKKIAAKQVMSGGSGN